jgi:23S rRNA (guanine745-N1)-methyltransferase
MTVRFQCPTCDKPLMQHAASQGYYCEHKHHFDLSEQGYWVFAKPARQKPTGDSRQLLRAKRFLLESGIYDPLLASVARLLGEHFGIVKALPQLDYACGDGFYLRALVTQLAAQEDGLTLAQYGVADAENAIFAAAKAGSGERLYLASSKKLPFADDSFELVTVFDKPLKGKECVRVLAPEGLMLLVLPGPGHLWQLQSQVYPDSTEKAFALNLPRELEAVAVEEVRFTLNVTGEQALTLLDMSPYAWRANDKLRQQIAQGQYEAMEADFRLVLAKQKMTMSVG